MQLKQIGRLCTASKSVNVLYKIDGNGCVRQFVGDGYCLYEVDDLGESVTLEIMQTIFDAKPEERGRWAFNSQTLNIHPLLEDYDSTDEPVQEIPMRIYYLGVMFIPFKSSRGIMFVPSHDMKPLRDEIKQGGVTFLRRGNYNAILVKKGLLGVIAYIQTMLLPEGAIRSLYEITRLIDEDQGSDKSDETIDDTARATQEPEDEQEG